MNVTSLKFKYSRTPIIRTLVIRNAYHPRRFCLSGKFVENFTKLTLLKITGYRVLYSTMLWLLEFQISSGGKVKMAGPCKGNGSWGNAKKDDGRKTVYRQKERKTSFEMDG